MTGGKPSSPAGTPGGGSAWTRRDLDIIARRMDGRPRFEEQAAAGPPRARESAQAQHRRRPSAAQVAVLAVLGLALLAFLWGALAQTDRSAAPAPREVAGRASPPPSGSPTPPEPPGPPPTAAAAEPGEATVRDFYAALGRADGAAASALVVPEKRRAEAYAPAAISRFYGGLAEPLRLTAVTPLPDGRYRVAYRYSAGRRPCEGEAVVALAPNDGRPLIRSIRALNGC